MSTTLFKTDRTLTISADARRWFDFYSSIFDDTSFWDNWLAETALASLLSTAVVSLSSKKTSGAGQTLTAPSTKRPVWVADDGDGMAAIQFVGQFGGAPDLLPMTGFPASASANWTKWAIIKAATMNGATNKADVFSTEATGNRHQINMNYNGGSLDYVNVLIGATPNQINLTYASRPLDEWFLIEQSWDATNHKAGIAINGGAFTYSQATTAVPSPGPTGDPSCVADVTAVNFGALTADGSLKGFNGKMRAFGVYQGDISTDADARAALKEFASTRGCTVA